MPEDQTIIGLPGFKIIKVERHPDAVVFEVECEIEPVCPHCGLKRVRIKDSFVRRLRHESLESRNGLCRRL